MSWYDDTSREIHPATFTMTLHDVLEAHNVSLTIENNLSKLTGGDDIGLYNYPIFDASYRDTLNGKIVDHFYNREIGQESDSIFMLALRRKMNEIMPYYNLLYLSTKIAFDPLSTIDLTTVTTGTTTQSGTDHSAQDTTSNGTAISRSVGSETPQTMLSGDEDYATNATDANSQSNNAATATNDATSSNDVTADGNTHSTGYQGVSSELIMRYRQSLINVDVMVIQELETLFMGVFDNGDSYTGRGGIPIYGYGPFGFVPWF